MTFYIAKSIIMITIIKRSFCCRKRTPMIYSKQRELVYAALKRSCLHPTADELYAMVKTEAPSISLATVYRNLNQIVSGGQAARISVPGSADRFDATNDGHLHMLCSRCGAVMDIPKTALPDICTHASRATGNRIEGYSILFYGLCAHCATASASSQHEEPL